MRTRESESEWSAGRAMPEAWAADSERPLFLMTALAFANTNIHCRIEDSSFSSSHRASHIFSKQISKRCVYMYLHRNIGRDPLF